jgi:signal transduction histidine kinase
MVTQLQPQRDAATRIAAYQRLLLELASDLTSRFDNVRLPIHILLDNRFGELNENQEEMLEAARSAADVAGESVRRLRDLVELELGTLTLTPVRQRADDVFRSVVSSITADAERARMQLIASVESPLPAIRVDAARVREALTLLVADAIRQSPERSTMRFTVSAREGAVSFVLEAPAHGDGVDRQLAVALLTAQGACVESMARGAAIVFPVAAADRPSPLISIA